MVELLSNESRTASKLVRREVLFVCRWVFLCVLFSRPADGHVYRLEKGHDRKTGGYGCACTVCLLSGTSGTTDAAMLFMSSNLEIHIHTRLVYQVNLSGNLSAVTVRREWRRIVATAASGCENSPKK